MGTTFARIPSNMEQSRVDSESRPPISAEAAVATPPAGTPNAARRRLMLGAGAILPSVYTLSSGAQTAVASTLACFNTSGTAPTRFVDTQDKWFRSQVYDGTNSGRASHCVSTPQNVCTNGAGGAPAGSVWVKNDGTRFVAGPGNQVNNVTSQPKSYGLVYVDRQGTINTLDPNGNTSLSYASIACYNSILGSRISTLG